MSETTHHHHIFDLIPVALWEEDLTEVAQGCEQLRRDEGVIDFHDFFVTHPDITARLASTARLVAANQRARALIIAHGMTGLVPVDEVLGPGGADGRARRLAAVANRRVHIEHETAFGPADSERGRAVLSQALVDQPDGTLRGLITLVELAQGAGIEDRVAMLTHKLAESRQEVEQFAYVASHDLQEPLRMIASYTQLLERRCGAAFDERAIKHMRYIVDGAKRMQTLISDLLELSRVGTRGKMLKPVSLASVYEEVQGGLRAAIAATGATVTADPLPEVLGDKAQLVQLLHQLMDNGIKFHGEQPPQVHVSATREGGHWRLSVRDNGIGISSKHWDAVFVIFRKLHARGEYPGTGIGLAIVKKIVERHGGRVWLDSEEGAGTTVHLTLHDTEAGLTAA